MARRIQVEILGDSRSLERAFGRSAAGAKHFNRELSGTVRGSLSATGAFHSLGRSVAFASSSFLGGAGLTFAIKSAIGSASQLQEETEKTSVVFGKSSVSLQKWARTLALSFGIGEGEALKFAGTFGNILRPLGFAESAASKMSERLVELAADMASFNNASPVDVLQAVQSGLAGQVRPLRQYGVFLSKARIETEAYRAGIAKTGAELTQQQKIQAAYNIILKDTRLAQGDVARNTESLSVAQSKLRAAFEDAEAVVGRALLPKLVELANKGARYLENLRKTGELQRKVNDAMKRAGEVVRALVEDGRKLFGVADTIAKSLGGWKIALELLVTAKILGKLASLTRAFAAIRTAALLAAGAELAVIDPLLLIGVATAAMAVVAIANWDALLEGVQRYTIGLDGVARKTKQTQDEIFADMIKRARQAGSTGPEGLIGQGGNPAAAPLKGGITQRGGTSPRFGFGKTNEERAQDAQDTADRKRIASRQRHLSLRARFNRAELALAKAGLTKQQSDDRKQLVIEAQIIKEQIASSNKAFKDKTALYNQLGEIEGRISALDDQAATNRKNAREKQRQQRENRQFRALGLGPGGATLAPTKAALKNELGTVSDALRGTFLDTNATRSVLSKIRKLMSGQLGAMSADVRSVVKQMLDDLKGQLTEFDGFNLTKAEKRRRSLDKALSGPIGGGGRRTQSRGGGGNTYIYSPQIKQGKHESDDALHKRNFFRMKVAFSH